MMELKTQNIVKKEYKINKFITLKLIKNETQIYIDDKPFGLCKKLMINIPLEKVKEFNNIKTIEEAEDLSYANESKNMFIYEVTPEQEFWAHCSNIQVWVENDYDTRLLHHSIAFQLLDAIAEAGEQLARKRIKDEIILRFNGRHNNTRISLYNQGLLDKYFSFEEFWSFFNKREKIFFEDLKSIIGNELKFPNLEFIFNQKTWRIESLFIKNLSLREIPNSIFNLKYLRYLVVIDCNLEVFPESINRLQYLEHIDFSGNKLKFVPSNLEMLKKLNFIDLRSNEIPRIKQQLFNIKINNPNFFEVH